MNLSLYTDGSCLKNPGGKGGWAWVLAEGITPILEAYGHEKITTNNRMEIMAVIQGLESLSVPIVLKVFTDSMYVVDTMNKNWIRGWERRDWRTVSGTPVANKDLWQRLAIIVERHDIVFEWVRGHNGDPFNERCDLLARWAAENQISSERKFWTPV